MSKYNKALIRDNIKFLASKKGIKIGEVETEAGVSAGYLSRIVNDNNSSNALLDVIMTFADKMDVTVDSLMNVNFSQLSPDEKYLADFFHSLIFKTRGHQINWVAETQTKLSDPEYMENHPLFISNDYDQYFYHSSFNRFNRNTENIYYAELNNVIIYLVKVLDGNVIEDSFAYEIYFYKYKQKNLTPLDLFLNDNNLYNILVELYMAAEISSTNTHVSENARSIIDNIMNSSQYNPNPNNNVWNDDNQPWNNPSGMNQLGDKIQQNYYDDFNPPDDDIPF